MPVTYSEASWAGVGGRGRAEVGTGGRHRLPPRGLFWQEHRQDLSHWEEIAALTAQFLR